MTDQTFFQSGNVQNADQIFNIGDSRDWLTAGRQLLAERAYREAARCFEKFLAQGPEHERTLRAEANVLVVIATLARHPPSYRTPRQAAKLTHHLVASATALAKVLAGLIRDDYYRSVGISVPADLAKLASKASPDPLTMAELHLIEQHVVAVPGPTWRELRAHCQLLGIILPAFVPEPPGPVATRERRVGVPKYFVAIPPVPPPDRGLLAGTMMCSAIVLIVLPCGGFYVETRWYVVLALLLLLPAAGLILGMIGIGVWRDNQQDRRARRRYEEARSAAEGSPSDEQMDRWLREDVERIVARGARRLRLNSALSAGSGDLLVEPQAAVGISRLEKDEMIEQIVSQGGGTGVRVIRRRTTISKSRVGRDGKLRSDHYQVLVLYLSAHRVSVFKCDLALATRQLLTESTATFHYQDVVSISSQTVVLPKTTEATGPIFDEVTGRYVRRFADSRFTVALVNGQQMEVSVSVTAESRELEVAWSNSDAHRVVERMVWSRKEQEESESL
ncbi:hypothetical protein [Micromonospora sp. SL4-19]|uniref:hypothetical protein n=1 Tax=Micromonospora sp. SL4-19 TaxID=3399129 RepID=UPI003A4D30CB